MTQIETLLKSLQGSAQGLMLAEILIKQPEISRRTAQRQLAKLVESGQVIAKGDA
ncbi:MAG: hypothetical protein KGP13_11520 [Burkholderiales bacterium]|nr:hypothetical protein [Burkholderiales bacterium]